MEGELLGFLEARFCKVGGPLRRCLYLCNKGLFDLTSTVVRCRLMVSFPVMSGLSQASANEPAVAAAAVQAACSSGPNNSRRAHSIVAASPRLLTFRLGRRREGVKGRMRGGKRGSAGWLHCTSGWRRVGGASASSWAACMKEEKRYFTKEEHPTKGLSVLVLRATSV